MDIIFTYKFSERVFKMLKSYLHACAFLLTREKLKSDDFKNHTIPSLVIFSSSNLHFILYFKSDKWYDIIQYKSTLVVSIVTKPYNNMFPHDIDIRYCWDLFPYARFNKCTVKLYWHCFIFCLQGVFTISIRQVTK